MRSNNVNVDEQLERMLQRHEAGDSVNYVQFGKLIFRELNGQELYRNNSKINLNAAEVSVPSSISGSFVGVE